MMNFKKGVLTWFVFSVFSSGNLCASAGALETLPDFELDLVE